MMSITESDPSARSADVALEVLVRAYHALAIVYELSSPGAYAALDRKMMPYLLDSFRHADTAGRADASAAETFTAAIDRVRGALAEIRCDVAAVRTRREEREG